MAGEASVHRAECADCGAPRKVYLDGVPYCTTCALARRVRARSTRALCRWLNVATADDLARLRGIGPVLAGRITTHRERNGPFEKVDDLLDVEGLGKVAVATLKSGLAGAPGKLDPERATRYERRSAHLPALGEAAREFSADATRLRDDGRSGSFDLRHPFSARPERERRGG